MSIHEKIKFCKQQLIYYSLFMSTFSILELNQLQDNQVSGQVATQIQSVSEKKTKNGKPYLEVTFVDSSSSFSLKIWDNSPDFDTFASASIGQFIGLDADWSKGDYGIEAKNLSLYTINDEDKQAFLQSDPETTSIQEQAWQDINELAQSIQDPRFNLLCQTLLTKHADSFRRAAAARRNHHARRGGLIEHVSQMMRAADALCLVYPTWNRDLLLTGTLFHDIGKLWENNYPKDSLTQTRKIEGELMGHIPLGTEFVNHLWKEIQTEHADVFNSIEQPNTHEAKLHLLHLILSHHGQFDYGSPVTPKTPEAWALHYIDNIDAKHEMSCLTYAEAGQITDQIYDRRFPLTEQVKPLGKVDE